MAPYTHRERPACSSRAVKQSAVVHEASTGMKRTAKTCLHYPGGIGYTRLARRITTLYSDARDEGTTFLG